MCKSEIFAKIIALVSKGTEIPTELIVSDNRVTEIVNARYILVYILYEKGFYPSQISSLSMLMSTVRLISVEKYSVIHL